MGAEGNEPVTCTGGKLIGIKRFASGLNNIALAVVPVGNGTDC